MAATSMEPTHTLSAMHVGAPVDAPERLTTGTACSRKESVAAIRLLVQ
jgi:hypothetical protein